MDNSWAAPGVWCECISIDVPTDPVSLMLLAKYSIKIPEVGSRHQIYDVVEHHTERGRIGLRLVGNSPLIVFDIGHFRPLTEKDAEMFQSMLKDTPVEEDA